VSTASMAASGLAGRSRISKRILSASSVVESHFERYGLGGAVSAESMGDMAGTASAVCSFNAAGASPVSRGQNSASIGGSFGSVEPSATGALEMSV
jgi:hypothetical protein